MGIDKKRKRSKEEEPTITSGGSRAKRVEVIEETSRKMAEVISASTGSNMRNSKESKEDKKEIKDKKNKKEKKEKKKRGKEKKEKKRIVSELPLSSLHSEADSDTTTSLGMDMDVDLTPTATTEEQRIMKALTEVKETSDQGRDSKKAKDMILVKSVKFNSKDAPPTLVMNTSNITADHNISSSDDSGDSRKDNESGKDGDKKKTNQLKLDGLTKKERKLLKIKERQFNRKSEGDGEPAFILKDGHDLTLGELRDLVVFILTETPSLPWIQVLNKFKIEKVLLLYISGLDPKLFHMNARSSDAHKSIAWAQRADTHMGPVEEFEHLREYFDRANVVKAAGDKFRIFSPTNTLLNVPLSNSEKVKREKEKERKEKSAGRKTKPENYMMSLEELQENKFPLPRYLLEEASNLGEGWIETPKLKKTTLTPPPKTMIAIDCEMCKTTAGTELTRVTLINHEGKVILDELVRPENPVLDYLTQYSGMTAAKLEGVTTRLVDVQKKLKKIINYNTILVGHSLENDMTVLKLAHPFIIDTSLIFHHTRGPPYRPGLKWLAQKWLQRHIQDNVERGHDSAEDALACMDLVKLKLLKPKGFGEYEQDQESLFSRLHRFNTLRTSALVDSDAFAGQSATTTIRTASDEEVVKAIPEVIQKHNFVWARLRDIEINHGKVPEQTPVERQEVDKGRGAKISSADKIQASEEEIRAGIRSIDKSVKAIMDSLPSRTAVIITSGQGDHREVSRLQARQKVFQELLKQKGSINEVPQQNRFLEEDMRKLEIAVEDAKGGICLLTVKK